VSHGSRSSVGGGTRDGGKGRVKSIAQGNPRGGGRARSFQRFIEAFARPDHFSNFAESYSSLQDSRDGMIATELVLLMQHSYVWQLNNSSQPS
jgi:hypothetical protein